MWFATRQLVAPSGRYHQKKNRTVTPLYTVHRIDKDTSGLVCFAKTKLAERGLHKIFKEHQAEREYTAVARGQVRPGRIESQLIENRGDGLRGSSKGFGQGQRAVTDVEVVENLRRASAAARCDPGLRSPGDRRAAAVRRPAAARIPRHGGQAARVSRIE